MFYYLMLNGNVVAGPFDTREEANAHAKAIPCDSTVQSPERPVDLDDLIDDEE